ncbi:uncharacterized protein BX664DRAFT_342823 [Halteromyces radiatus]|uniref:uncharacterized protein n=1 Tax=Halteromyces radiatus TaxID=101107 RepID=UPI00221FAB44|nr:uncharacterized protein BX664DRAFT_342823 [Halteromyces radiatus]KAI8078833.1 hypothetical protein BX664DRAFT_342823 [Halteromyces radiatus]
MANNTCCCCIPIRAGVLIIATLSALFYIATLVCLLVGKGSLLNPEYSERIIIGYWILFGLSILYTLSSIFGIVGGLAKNRGMTNIFKVLYWLMAILMLILSVGLWIASMVNRDETVAVCSDILQHPGTYNGELTTYNYPKAQADEICSSSMRNLLIGMGIGVFVGNLIQLYFACVISAYATRLRRTNQHERLRNLEDFPVEPVGKAHY